LLVCVAGAVLASALAAQELEPRAYSPSPVGTNFLVVAYTHISGDIVFDPTVPITNASASLNGMAIGVGRTFGVFGRQCLFVTALPYSWGSAQGQVREVQGYVTRSGLIDLYSKLSFNLHGSPALSPREFASSRKRTWLMGASLSFKAPTGQYDGTKLINLGNNRWALKPEVGVSIPVKKLDVDFYVGTWFFTQNDQYYPGTSTRKQDPLTGLQAHVSYTVRRGLWLAVDSTWYAGGATSVNGGPATGRQQNSRLGGTVSLPIGKIQSVKVTYSTGATTRVGQDFNQLSVAWQVVWIKHKD